MSACNKKFCAVCTQRGAETDATWPQSFISKLRYRLESSTYVLKISHCLY